jgi:hypothetical protein
LDSTGVGHPAKVDYVDDWMKPENI